MNPPGCGRDESSPRSAVNGLRLHAPEFASDLPAGGKRLVQRAGGYVHTFVAGTEIRAAGDNTGATPGRLVRGAQPAPVEAAAS